MINITVKEKVVIETPDTTAPVMNYDGEKAIELAYGSNFTMPSVTATDETDGEVEVVAVITKEGKEVARVDTNNPGVYVLTYTAVDKAGNEKELVINIRVRPKTNFGGSDDNNNNNNGNDDNDSDSNQTEIEDEKVEIKEVVSSSGTTEVELEVKSDVTGTTAKASVEADYIKEALEKVMKEAIKEDTSPRVIVSVLEKKEVDKVVVDIEEEALEELTENPEVALEIKTSWGELVVSNEALKSINKQVDGEAAVFNIGVAKELSDHQKVSIGERKAFDIEIHDGDISITNFDGEIEINLPYELGDGEEAETITAIYVDEQGMKEVMQSTYDEKTEQLTFETDHLSVYMIDEKEESQVINPFTDIKEDAWYYDAVMFVNQKGWMNGVTETSFKPQATMSRAMLSTILHRIEGAPETMKSQEFKDVVRSSWYTQSIDWAVKEGIYTGFEDATFRPNEAITREQFVKVLYNYSKSKGYSTSNDETLKAFADCNEVSAWADEAMKWAVSHHLIEGKANGKLDPQGEMRRAEVAKVLTVVVGSNEK